MLVGIQAAAGEDVGGEDPAEGPPLGADGDPDDGILRVVVGVEAVGDIAGGESKILFLEDFFCCSCGGDD